MKLKLGSTLAAAAAFAFSASAFATDITGAGATFPYPIYAKWAEAYKAQTGIGMNYQSIGSGGGIKQIKAKTVDFGASDMPLKPEELDKEGLTQFPAVMGGDIPVYNLPEFKSGALRFTGDVLAKIYMGKITKWNDPQLVALNKGTKMPNDAITVVHRSDGSGTTFIWTNYLSKVSPDWKTAVGEGTSVAWPVGTGGKGNEGVANFVKQIRGAIGYVEYAYALQNKMSYGTVKNSAGYYTQPDDNSFKAAAANAHWDSATHFYQILTDEPGAGSWPITGATFILMHTTQSNPAQATNVLKFFDWAYANGGKMATDLDYVPMPESVVKLIENHWKTHIKGADGKAVY